MPPAGLRGSVQRTERWRFDSPFPPPQVMADYANVHPTFAERVFTKNEEIADHRMREESTAAHRNHSSRRLGQWLSFITAMTMLIGAYLSEGVIPFGAVALRTLYVFTGIFVLGRLPEWWRSWKRDAGE